MFSRDEGLGASVKKFFTSVIFDFKNKLEYFIDLLEKLALLVPKFINYGQKEFYNIAPGHILI
jgi:hypothetical protein